MKHFATLSHAAAATGLLLCAACAVLAKEEDKAVKEAIQRGKDYLLARQDANGIFEGQYKDQVGNTALVVCALRKAGVPADHEAIKKALPHILKYADSNYAGDSKVTYNVGICLLALDALHGSRADAYGAAAPDKQIKSAAEKFAATLLRSQGSRGGWHYFGKRDGDLSCTQYGGLGLWAAERLGVPIQRGVWDFLSQYAMKVHQDEGGGFTYGDAIKKSAKPTHSMTAAGIGTLALALRQATKKEMVRETVLDNYSDGKKTEKKTEVVEARKPQTEIEKAIEKAFTALRALDFDSKNAKNAYYWYALERACALTGTQQLNGAPWFEVLSKQILTEQKPNGSWINGHDATCDTAWALLALSRATEQMIHPGSSDSGSSASGSPASKPAAKKAEEGKPTTPSAPAKPKPNAKTIVDE